MVSNTNHQVSLPTNYYWQCWKKRTLFKMTLRPLFYKLLTILKSEACINFRAALLQTPFDVINHLYSENWSFRRNGVIIQIILLYYAMWLSSKPELKYSPRSGTGSWVAAWNKTHNLNADYAQCSMFWETYSKNLKQSSKFLLKPIAIQQIYNQLCQASRVTLQIKWWTQEW